MPALFAVWLYWPARNGGLLADELLLAHYVRQPGPDGFQAAWHRVAEDFVGPWAFRYGGYYRPLATLSLVLDQWLANGAEWMLHCTSIALFAVCTFTLGRLCGILFGPLAALLGGFWIAAHPAAHETICWPCTRADLLVLIASGAACCAMVRHLRGEPGRHLTWAVVASIFALLAKESGILLAVWFLLLDLALRGRAVPLPVRARLHLGFCVLWGLYAFWRHHVLGDALAEGLVIPFVDQPDWLGEQLDKVAAVMAPFGERLPATTPFTTGATMAWLLVGGTLLGQRRWIWVGLLWLAVSFAPAHFRDVSPNQNNSRFVFAGCTGCALWIAALLGRAQAPRWFRVVGILLLALALRDLASGTRLVQASYQVAWQHMAALRRAVDEAGARATAERPLVMLTGLPLHGGIPFLEPAGAFALAQPPLSRAEYPFVSLGLTLTPGVGPGLLAAEVWPWRSLWQAGAHLCYWLDVKGQGRLVEVPTPDAAPPVRFVATELGFALASGTPWSIGSLVVSTDAPFRGGLVQWSSPSGFAGAFALGPSRPDGERHVSEVEVAGDAMFLILGQLEGPPVFALQLQSDAAIQQRELRALPPPLPAPLHRPLRGASAALDDVAERLPLASLPPDADPGSAHAVLMNKALGFRVRQPGRPTELPPRAKLELRELDRFTRTDTVYYYLECTVRGRPWRSEVDWFRRERRPWR